MKAYFLNGQKNELSEIHSGALQNLPKITIVSKKLESVIARKRVNTHFDGEIEIEAEGGKKYKISSGTVIVQNAPGAPYGYGILGLIEKKEEDGIERYFGRNEVYQFKYYKDNTHLDVSNIIKEREKAARNDDIFGFITSKNLSTICANDLPSNTFLVHQGNWKEYYGPYTGRAFLSFQRPNINTSTSFFLRSIGIDSEIVKKVISNRNYKDFDDCAKKTGISKEILKRLFNQ
jgi:hypothetical protein